MATPAHVERLRVRYSDTDAQGIAHHSNYLRWLEEARIGWLAALASDYRQLNARGIHIPLTACACTFHRSVGPGDLLEVRLWVTTATRVRASFAYEVWRDGALVATASTAHAFVNAAGAPVRLAREDPFWRAVCAATGAAIAPSPTGMSWDRLRGMTQG
ncbi:MAG: acyl-CoA thioesterase [Actinobacteria bacterium]|nr:acyl-CoA thioesterase [Actinomycetota bacterium]